MSEFEKYINISDWNENSDYATMLSEINHQQKEITKLNSYIAEYKKEAESCFIVKEIIRLKEREKKLIGFIDMCASSGDPVAKEILKELEE